MQAVLHIGGFEIPCSVDWHSVTGVGPSQRFPNFAPRQVDYTTMDLVPRDNDKGGSLMELLWFALAKSEKETIANILKRRNVYIEYQGQAFDLVSLGNFAVDYGEPLRVSYDTDETYRTHPPIVTYKGVHVVRRVRPTVEETVTEALVIRPIVDDEDDDIKGYAVMLGRFRMANAKTQEKDSAKRLTVFQGIKWLLEHLGVSMDAEVRKEQKKDE